MMSLIALPMRCRRWSKNSFRFILRNRSAWVLIVSMATNYRTTIQIRRPSGEVETVDVSAKFPIGLDAKTFAAIRQNTRAAGRGEALSYEMVDLIGAEKRAAAAAAVAAQSAKEFANSTAGREARIFRNDR